MALKPPHLGAKPRRQAERERKRRYDQGRAGDEVRKLYSSARWRIERMHFLAEHPLCMCPECDEGRKRVTPADVVDHHDPHKGDLVKFWDRSNWRAMAKRCHDRKTATEDSGFARGTGGYPKV